MIRSGSLTYQQGDTPKPASDPTSSPPTNNVISAAKRSVDDDVEKPQTSQKPPQKPSEPDAESINMNDILMENVLKTTEEDRTEAVEEDNISISTNVIQEIDENELKKALKKSDEAPALKGRSGISKEMPSGSEDSDVEVEGDNRKMSVIEFIRSEAQAETSATISSPAPVKAAPVEGNGEEVENGFTKNEKMSEATQSEMSDSEDEERDEDSDVGKPISVVGMSSKTTARAERTPDAEERRIREFRELSSDESLKGTTEDEEEEIIVDEIPPPLPLSPPPNLYGQVAGSPIPPPRSPRRSLMYANADESDSDSDDEGSGDAHLVAVNALVRMHPVNFAPHREDDRQSVSSVSTASDLSEKENGTDIGITRISVKSDGRAEIHSPKRPVRVTLETDRNEVTDDDFSEKLI